MGIFDKVNRIPELCVANREHNGYHDSYFYATFYVPEDDNFVEVPIGTTAMAGGGNQYTFPIAAPKEIQDRYDAIILAAQLAREAATLRPGKKVTIARARKYKDMVGTVQWIKPNKYNYNRGEIACVKFDNGQVTYPDINRVVVVQPS